MGRSKVITLLTYDGLFEYRSPQLLQNWRFQLTIGSGEAPDRSRSSAGHTEPKRRGSGFPDPTPEYQNEAS